ncbi:hypothetical protein JWG39_11540 [Desulforhopalus vacuolatus]|nr:hypothetical protein [Desulforhopalus vacuolatus]
MKFRWCIFLRIIDYGGCYRYDWRYRCGWCYHRRDKVCLVYTPTPVRYHRAVLISHKRRYNLANPVVTTTANCQPVVSSLHIWLRFPSPSHYRHRVDKAYLVSTKALRIAGGLCCADFYPW